MWNKLIGKISLFNFIFRYFSCKQCVENVSRSNCPVCLGDIHTSRYPCHIPDCGHLLHKTCFDQLVSFTISGEGRWVFISSLQFIYLFRFNVLLFNYTSQLASGHYVCPTCQTSMIDMTKLWEYLDTQAQNLPVPKSHENSIVDIFCNDCFKVCSKLPSLLDFLFLFWILFSLSVSSNRRWNSILLDWNVPIVVDIIQRRTLKAEALLSLAQKVLSPD